MRTPRRTFDRAVASAWYRIERIAARVQSEKAAAACASMGEGSRFVGRVRLMGGDRVEIGDNVLIQDNVTIRGEGCLRIGDNTRLGRNAVIYTANHDTEGVRLPFDEGLVRKSVTIGRNVWVGMNACIVPGTTIGDGAIVGMGTVVSGTIEPGAVVVGAGCRVVGHRDPQHYEALDEAGSYAGVDGRPLGA